MDSETRAQRRGSTPRRSSCPRPSQSRLVQRTTSRSENRSSLTRQSTTQILLTSPPVTWQRSSSSQVADTTIPCLWYTIQRSTSGSELTLPGLNQEDYGQ